ncbi:hypothetical protein [Syntrophomonas erecta]
MNKLVLAILFTMLILRSWDTTIKAELPTGAQQELSGSNLKDLTNQAKAPVAINTDWQPVSAKDYPAFQEVVKAFTIYTSFFNQVVWQDGYAIPKNGLDSTSAQHFLSQGFEDTLAAAIVSTYTEWIAPLQKLAILPCEGIPVLTEADFKDLLISQPAPDRICFRKDYYNCYQVNDHYIFLVYCRLNHDTYIIESLTLQEAR